MSLINQLGVQTAGLRIVNLSMKYPNESKLALDCVSIKIAPGEVHGILGPNGSGKTTLSKIASGLLIPTCGEVFIDGESHWKIIRSKTNIGLVLGGDRGFYGRATVLENLMFFTDLIGIKGEARMRRVGACLELTNLSEVRNKKVNELSKGMKQRLHISRAMLGEPTFLILDEPTSGLDPEVALLIRQNIQEIARKGAAVMLTTHYLTEAEYLADKVSLFQRGKKIKSGTLDQFVNQGEMKAISKFSSEVSQDVIEEWIKAGGLDFKRVESSVHGSRYRYSIIWESTPSQEKLSKFVHVNMLNRYFDFETREPSREEIYISNFYESTEP